MAISQRLDLRQTQGLVMTPQLQQAIKLLQLSNLELSAYVEAEIERNPMLDRPDDVPGGDGFGDDIVAAGPPEPAEGAVNGHDAAGPDSSIAARDETPLDTDLNSVWGDDIGSDRAGDDGGSYAQWGFGGQGGRFDDSEYGPEQSLSNDITLREHLVEQFGVTAPDARTRLIGTYMIDCLEDSGWLTVPLEQIAENLGCDVAEIEAVLATLQTLEPVGVFARSLGECLALQLREKDRLDPAMAAMLDNLDLLAARDVAALKRICGVDEEDLADMAAEIRRLNPKPAFMFDAAPLQPVVPDVLMRPNLEGGWNVELNTDALPRVLVNSAYYAKLKPNARSSGEREYLVESLNAANWLVKSLHQRATTILKVATEIVAQQDQFFAYGVTHLRPLILRDIADAIEMHESTVSRVTTNKFIATPRGIFELKYFFTAAIQGSSGDMLSAEAVRHRIRDLIGAETQSTVLSDDQIVDALRGAGVVIARRTVAKYREAMRIPSSVQRRRQLAAAL